MDASLPGSVGMLTFVTVLHRIEPCGAFGCAGHPAYLQPVADHGRQCGDGYAFTADTYATVLPEQARQTAKFTAQLILEALRMHDSPEAPAGNTA